MVRTGLQRALRALSGSTLQEWASSRHTAHVAESAGRGSPDEVVSDPDRAAADHSVYSTHLEPLLDPNVPANVLEGHTCQLGSGS